MISTIMKACRTCFEVFWAPKEVVLCGDCLKGKKRRTAKGDGGSACAKRKESAAK